MSPGLPFSAARAARRRNDRHLSDLRRRRSDFRVNTRRGAYHAVGLRQLIAEMRRFAGRRTRRLASKCALPLRRSDRQRRLGTSAFIGLVRRRLRRRMG